jgi:hypothetical protein
MRQDLKKAGRPSTAWRRAGAKGGSPPCSAVGVSCPVHTRLCAVSHMRTWEVKGVSHEIPRPGPSTAMITINSHWVSASDGGFRVLGSMERPWLGIGLGDEAIETKPERVTSIHGTCPQSKLLHGMILSLAALIGPRRPTPGAGTDDAIASSPPALL